MAFPGGGKPLVCKSVPTCSLAGRSLYTTHSSLDPGISSSSGSNQGNWRCLDMELQSLFSSGKSFNQDQMIIKFLKAYDSFLIKQF